jgi:hypothetical protein
MDNLLLLTLALMGVSGWISGAIRQGGRLWVRILALPSCVWLGFYGLIVLGRARPQLFSPDAQIGHVTLALIVVGLLVMMDEPKRRRPNGQGGEQSA